MRKPCYKMESAGNGTNIVILDACRNNPFTRSYRSAQQGLAQMDAPVGTLVAYATAPGSVAVDSGRGMRNGLYTTHLLDAVRNRGLKVEDVFKQVRNAVLRASSNKQMPWEASALVGDFYFHPPAPAPGQAQAGGSTAQPAPDPAIAVDDALWEAVKDARGSAEIFAYLSRFPRGRHAREARRRLLELTEPAQGSAFATTLSTPPGDPDALERLGATSARLTREFAAGMTLSRRPSEASATWGESQTSWGTASTEGRPAQAQRNAQGFSVGDRFRYRLTDLAGVRRSQTTYLWRVDRIDPDGSLWVNDGRQRLDPFGQRRSGNEELSGVWLDFAPPLPLAEAMALGPGVQGTVATTVTERDADGQVTSTDFDGTWRGGGGG